MAIEADISPVVADVATIVTNIFPVVADIPAIVTDIAAIMTHFNAVVADIPVFGKALGLRSNAEEEAGGEEYRNLFTHPHN